MTAVVFDTNIYISAFEFGGIPRQVFLLAAQREFDLWTSKPLLDELFRVLCDRFEYSHDMATEVRKRLEWLCLLAEPGDRIEDCTDPDDNRVLECAVAARAQYLVTGDRALLRLTPFRGCRILSAAQFLAERHWLQRQ